MSSSASFSPRGRMSSARRSHATSKVSRTRWRRFRKAKPKRRSLPRSISRYLHFTRASDLPSPPHRSHKFTAQRLMRTAVARRLRSKSSVPVSSGASSRISMPFSSRRATLKRCRRRRLDFASARAWPPLPAEAPRLRLSEVVSTLARSVAIEMDFRLEAAAASEMAANTREDADFRVPAINWDPTASEVLTLEWIDGIRLSDHRALEAKGFDLPQLGHKVI